MKDIKDYIKEITTKENVEYDDIDAIVLDHCYYHYHINYRLVTEGTIYESSTSKFPGQDELVINILKYINNNFKDTKIIGIDNKFVDKIYIHFKHSDEEKIYGAYIYDNSKYEDYNEVKWDNDNSKFMFAEIDIYNIDNNVDDLEEILYHETKHIWDDYQLMLHHNVNLSKIVHNHKSDKEIINDILYYGSKYEISAYLSQLNGVLGKNKYNNIKDALDDIVKSAIYQNYKYLYYCIIEDKYKDDLLKEISNKEYNKIKSNIRKAWDKIIHHIYIICGEHITENRMPPSTTNLFLEYKYNSK